MTKLLKSISYAFHPLITPLMAVVFYFNKVPGLVFTTALQTTLISLILLTFIVPVLLYFLLKITGKVNSLNLQTTQERVYPLSLNCIIILFVLSKVLNVNQITELFYFFLGLLISNIVCLMLVFYKIKASIHMITMTNVFVFVIALNLSMNINNYGLLALFCIVLGAVALSRLLLKAHTGVELIIGSLIGLLSQWAMVSFWL